MNTEILKINDESLEYAKKLIEEGKLVAFPTETVYGLGANAFDDAAVKSIFSVKGRPQDNPLIVHVHRDYDIRNLVSDIKPYAENLKRKYMPGPLTLVMKNLGKVSKAVTAGGDTLAVRIPSHLGAQEFLKRVNLPIAAPSANISKHTSPVTAEHVYEDFKGKIPLILQGGRCEGGIESTVVDATGDYPKVLRPGLITAEMIKKAAGGLSEGSNAGGGLRSPGMKYRHYHPDCKTVLYKKEDVDKAALLYEQSEAEGLKAAIMCDYISAKYFAGKKVFNLGAGMNEISRNLYYYLRKAEKSADILICIEPEGKGLEGALNRLTKACADD